MKCVSSPALREFLEAFDAFVSAHGVWVEQSEWVCDEFDDAMAALERCEQARKRLVAEGWPVDSYNVEIEVPD